MVQGIMRNETFLIQKAEPANPEDLSVAQDLLDTLTAHKDGCVGMAANMIGINKRIIAFDNEGSYMVMFNPEIVKKSGPYEAEEGCLSLTGIRKANLNCDGKLRDVKGSAFVLRRLNDELCKAHGLSVIENPKPSAKKQKEMAAAKYGTSHKEQLRQTIDRVLSDCQGYDDFLAKMRAEGYEIKEGKMLSFRAPGWDRFTRSSKLGSDYTKEALRERSTVRRGHSGATEKAAPHIGQKVNMLIDIQAKITAGKGLAMSAGQRFSI